MSLFRRRLKWTLALSLLFLFAVEPVYAQVPPSSTQLVAAFCTLAQWKSSRILSTHDIIEDAYRAASPAAQGMGVPLDLKTPDIGSWRSQIRSLKDKVCAASDVQASQKAMEELGAAANNIMKETQTALDGMKPVMDAAKLTIDQRTKEQMKPFQEEARTRSEKENNAERARLLREGTPPDTLTPEEQQQLQSFVEQKKKETETWLKAKGQEIAGPSMERLKAVGDPFKTMKGKLEAHKSASEVEWPTIRGQFVQKQKETILKDIDDKIADMKARVGQQAQGLTQEERDKQGITALLSAIATARGSLEQSLVTALEARNQQGIRQAVDTFFGSWAQALCTSTVGRLETARGQAEKNLEQLKSIKDPTAQVQEAVAALSGLVQQIGQAQQACRAVGTTSGAGAFKELGETLNRVQQAAVEVRRAVEAVKTP